MIVTAYCIRYDERTRQANEADKQRGSECTLCQWGMISWVVGIIPFARQHAARDRKNRDYRKTGFSGWEEKATHK
jgi:hypothetical protein